MTEVWEPSEPHLDRELDFDESIAHCTEQRHEDHVDNGHGPAQRVEELRMVLRIRNSDADDKGEDVGEDVVRHEFGGVAFDGGSGDFGFNGVVLQNRRVHSDQSCGSVAV